MAIPLHLPTAKLREAAFPTIRQLPHNHRRVEKWWNLENVADLPCCCDWIRQRCLKQLSTAEHILPVLLKISPCQHIFESSSPPMLILLFFTVGNHIPIFVLKKSRPGPNNMVCRPLLMMTFGISSIDNGLCIPENWLRTHVSLLTEDQASSTMATKECHYPSCRSWTSKIDIFLPKIVLSRCLEYMGWSRAFSPSTPFQWTSATKNFGIRALFHTKELQMGYQHKIQSSLRICIFEEEETIQERQDFDFIFPESIWPTSPGYSTHYRFHASPTMAPNDGTIGGTSDLGTNSPLFWWDPAWHQATCGQWVFSVLSLKIDCSMPFIPCAPAFWSPWSLFRHSNPPYILWSFGLLHLVALFGFPEKNTTMV